MADDLLLAAFDTDPPGLAAPAPCSYLVCGTPRSGTTLLCEGLRATGRLGVPAEYFNMEQAVAPLRARWGSPTTESFVRDLYRYRTSAGGVLGVKLHWQQVEQMRDELGLGGGGCERAMLEALFPRARHVHVFRRERDRQAVSYWVAEHTRQWSVHRGEEPPPAEPPGYDYAGIAALHRRIEHGEASWARYFAECGSPPVRVAYEDLAAAYPEVVAQVANVLGVDVRPVDVPAPRLLRQADDHSERLLERYRADGGGKL